VNILIDALPTAVTVGRRVHELRTDFRTCLMVITAFEDNDLTHYEKQLVMLANLYVEIPANIEEAAKKLVWFMNGGREPIEDESSEPAARLYSISHDAQFIYSAFRQTHGIDLATEDMHWWKFLALFMDLGSETVFCNLVGLRKRISTGKASRDDMQSASELGDVFKVPELDDLTPDERDQEREFMRLVKAGGGLE
jgi:hypothetical protein